MELIPQIAISFFVVIVSLTVHETAHAASAYALGDPTAKNMGRMSLNPLVHIDPIGTILLPILLAVMQLGVFGWAKPVPVNPANLRHPRRDDALVAAAGPVSNLVLACVSAFAIRSLLMLNLDSQGMYFIVFILVLMVRINIFLMLFNLLPIAPLDGSGVLQGFLSPQSWLKFRQLSQRFVIFFLLILLLTDWFYTFYLEPVSRVFFFGLQYIAGIRLI
ncbi:MAG TPA: site-2 protease family protein [bacterium]|nr:site-2 protease family protein [bacterium]